ncbi:retention module-containing protein, partial [Nitrincola alkalisediminis]
MENYVAIVTSLTGDVWARSIDGSLRLLQVGDVLLPGETLVTATGSEAVLDFGGEQVSVGSEQSLLMSASQRSTAPDVSDESVVVDPTLDAILAALDGEGDLLDELEAPAAGTDGAPDGGGASFVQLTRIVEAVDPLSFQFGISGTESFDGLIFDGSTVNDPGTLTTVVNNPNTGSIVVTGDTTNVPPGNTVIIVITDKNNNTVTTSAVVEENGSYTSEEVDVTDLTDGPITIDTSTTDTDGNPVTDQSTVELDIVESEIIVETEVDNTGPSITVTGDTTDIPPGSELEITVTDKNGNTVTATAIVEEDGS